MARAASVTLNRTPVLSQNSHPGRSTFLLVLLSVAFGALAIRAGYVHIARADFLTHKGEQAQQRQLELPASRGKIYDRNGTIVASSIEMRALFVVPQHYREALRKAGGDAGKVRSLNDRIAMIARLLGLPEADVRGRFENEERAFVYLKRQVDVEVARQIADLRMPGVQERVEYRRKYPAGDSLAHVVGFTNIEDVGLEGMERARESALAGRPGLRLVKRDNLRRVVEEPEILREPQVGKDLHLSIDTRVQYLTFNAVRDAVLHHKAKAGAAIVVDTHTGEVLALANWPSFDPNDRNAARPDSIRNRAITDTFEPGSTMKPFAVAQALDLGLTRPAEIIQTAPGRMTIGSATIGDAHAYGALSVEQVIQKSSNVGTVKIALRLEREQMWQMFADLGFGRAPQIDFPGAVAGRVRPWKNWKPIEQATMSYGHGMSVSLLQLARAYTALARDGDIVPLSFTRQDGPVPGQRVFSPKTMAQMRVMLEMAAGPEGTAPKSQVVGYRVAGKTGTAKKLERGQYTSKYVASFAGFAPASDPRIVIAVMVDEPSVNGFYGGQVAAPVFSQIATKALQTLNVPTDAPFKPLVIPAEPVVQESL